MKRSEINAAITEAKELFAQCRFRLPPWADWSVEQWKQNPDTAKWCLERQMGWDVTDFQAGRYAEFGTLLFCLRNGQQDDADGMPYAEKLMVVGESQYVPFHAHKVKMEDIIVRGGGNLVLEMFNTDEAGNRLETDVTVRTDGIARTVRAGAPLVLKPGESITIDRMLQHRFYGEPGKGTVLVGEVSQVNDDHVDNYFFEPLPRFSSIVEDEPALHPLWNELPVGEI
ncbi:MAG: D-lyxose/D-mannose family sugar isomerase [Rhodospirillales bacterium]|nr:D-lyxose/D-mannose family sugar isomerase [Rhodospirillales bacterium]